MTAQSASKFTPPKIKIDLLEAAILLGLLVKHGFTLTVAELRVQRRLKEAFNSARKRQKKAREEAESMGEGMDSSEEHFDHQLTEITQSWKTAK